MPSSLRRRVIWPRVCRINGPGKHEFFHSRCGVLLPIHFFVSRCSLLSLQRVVDGSGYLVSNLVALKPPVPARHALTLSHTSDSSEFIDDEVMKVARGLAGG